MKLKSHVRRPNRSPKPVDQPHPNNSPKGKAAWDGNGFPGGAQTLRAKGGLGNDKNGGENPYIAETKKTEAGLVEAIRPPRSREDKVDRA